MLYMSAGDLGRLVGCIHHGADASSICPVPTDNADKLLYVVSTDDEHWLTRHLVELGSAESINVLGGVVKFMLDECHELGIAALLAVFGIKRDDEVRDGSEPLNDLLLCPCL
jgi:hypothetical protein